MRMVPRDSRAPLLVVAALSLSLSLFCSLSSHALFFLFSLFSCSLFLSDPYLSLILSCSFLCLPTHFPRLLFCCHVSKRKGTVSRDREIMTRLFRSFLSLSHATTSLCLHSCLSSSLSALCCPSSSPFSPSRSFSSSFFASFSPLLMVCYTQTVPSTGPDLLRGHCTVRLAPDVA